MPATLNEIKHNAQIEFSVVHWKEGNEKRRTFGRSNEAENVFRRAWLDDGRQATAPDRLGPSGLTSSGCYATTDGALLLVPVGASP